MTQKAKIFWSGRSQAVRLPKEFRFDGAEVVIRREGNAVVLEQIPSAASESAWIDGVVGRFSEDGLRAIEEDRPAAQERPALDALFR